MIHLLSITQHPLNFTLDLNTIKGVFMLRSIFLTFILGLAVFGINSTAAASNSIDLAKLVNTFLLPVNTDSALAWSVGAKPGSPIKWKTNGIADGTQCDIKEPFCRIGSAIVTVDGKVTHEVLKQTVQPGEWLITLGGALVGVSKVSITSDLSHDLDPSILTKAKINLTPVKCLNEPVSFGNVLYKVTAPNKKQAWLLNEWSCGSAGCSIGINIYYDAESTHDVQCHGGI